MPTQYIDKKAATTEITDKPNAAGIGSVAGETYVQTGDGVKKVARDAGSLNELTVTALNIGAILSFPDIPTADPAIAGRIWSNNGVLTVSAG